MVLPEDDKTNIFFDSILEGIEDYAIILLDKNGFIKGWNRGAEKLKDYKAEEVIGKNFSIFYTESDKQNNLPKQLLEIAGKEGKIQSEGWRVKKNNEVFWSIVSITAIRNDQNELEGFIKVTRDLSRELTEKEENESLEKRIYKLIKDLEDIALCILDKDLNILTWNIGAEKMYGYAPSEITGHNISKFYNSQNIEDFQITDKLIEEKWLTKKDHTIFWAKIIITPIYDKDKKGIGYYYLSYDLTDKKRYEDYLLKSKNETEAKNKEIGEVTYIVSHDLQQPLRTISSFTEYLYEEYGKYYDEEGQQCVQYILEASSRMKILISDLLDYRRLDEKTEKTAIDCNKIVTDVLTDLKGIINKENATIEVSNMPVIFGYNTQVRLLFQNLINNAIKFHKEGINPHIFINAVKENDKWLFSIKDNGRGIDNKYFKKIFQIFQRLNTVTDIEGTGIGLAHCDKIVKQHGGRIWVESAINEGTTFYFTL